MPAMPDDANPTPQPAPQPARWRPTRRTKFVIAALLFIVWTLLAGQWDEKGCDFIPQSYGLVLTHGTPDRFEGCDDEPGGPTYTDDYYG